MARLSDGSAGLHHHRGRGTTREAGLASPGRLECGNLTRSGCGLARLRLFRLVQAALPAKDCTQDDAGKAACTRRNGRLRRRGNPERESTSPPREAGAGGVSSCRVRLSIVEFQTRMMCPGWQVVGVRCWTRVRYLIFRFCDQMLRCFGYQLISPYLLCDYFVLNNHFLCLYLCAIVESQSD